MSKLGYIKTRFVVRGMSVALVLALVVAVFCFANALGTTPDDAVTGQIAAGRDATAGKTLTTAVAADEGGCPGAIVDLTPDNSPTNTAVINNADERGVFVTALKDFELCAIGMEIDIVPPRTMTARVYEANGTTRGALIASGSVTAVQDGKVMHYVPISVTLSACRDYDIVVEYPINDEWDWWDENLIDEPFDVGGVIRVRDGERIGSPSNFALCYFSVIGREPSCDEVVALGPGGLAITAGDDNQQRGVFVRPDRTVSLCSFGWYADLVPPQTITARVYDAVGTVRGALIAEGTAAVTASGTRWHDVPINATLSEGMDYDLAISFGTANGWRYWDDRALYPYSVSPFDSINGEYNGNAGNWALPYYRAGFTEGVGGAPINLGKLNDVYPPPNSTAQDHFDYGAYVTSLIDQEVYSVGWKADVPAGEIIGARIYEASGTTRGGLITEGFIFSSGNGMRWHDVPVAATLVNGEDYDIEIGITLVDEWRAWFDFFGLPYDSNGLMRVRDGEQGGSASNAWLIEMRYNGCNETATAVENKQPLTVPLYLGAPSPNPSGAFARVDFTLEEAGDVTLEVYDVKGRLVAGVIEDEFRVAGPHSAEIHTQKLPSGVYFVKLTTDFASLSRKFVVTR